MEGRSVLHRRWERFALIYRWRPQMFLHLEDPKAERSSENGCWGVYIQLFRLPSMDTCNYIHTYINNLYLSSDFSVAYIASISDPN